MLRRTILRSPPAAIVTGLVFASVLFASPWAAAQSLQDLDPLGPGNLTTSMKILAILTILTVAPGILLLTTAFTRIAIVLGFVRRALSLQEVPPNQVIVGLALILTFFVMQPTFSAIWDEAGRPYIQSEISDEAALDIAVGHIRSFMWAQVDPQSFDALAEVSLDGDQLARRDLSLDEVPLATLTSAFVLSELKRAFMMGFMIYLPFVVIDLVVASVLISMGMLVLPPVLISLPFKILIFVLVDGWELVVMSLANSF